MDAQREPTLRDVARLAGVHPSTASRCMDAVQSARIGAATRERVLAAARELGYQLNPAASSLRSRRTMTVGVLIPDFRNPIYGSLLTGINDRLEDSGYTAVIVETKDDERRMARALEVMRERRVDAVINTAAREQDQRPLARFVGQGIPMVLTSRDLPVAGRPEDPQRRLRRGHAGGGASARARPPPDRPARRAPGDRRLRPARPRIPVRAGGVAGRRQRAGEAGRDRLGRRGPPAHAGRAARRRGADGRVRPQRPARDGRGRRGQAGRALLPRGRLGGRVRRDPADRVPGSGADDRAVPRRSDGALRGRNRALGLAGRRTAVGRGAAAPSDHPGLHRPRA